MAPLRLRIDGRTFRDNNGREVTLHGINVAGDAKFPSTPDQPSHVAENFYDADHVSFIGRPFTVDSAHVHFSRLRKMGYNTIRYIFTWEAIEHEGPKKYDEEWVQHTIAVLRLAKNYGFYIFMDPHQDVWSRFSGGSGAPLWTLYACGLNPRAFDVTEAALVQNTYPEPEKFPKMIWATNYTRMACQVMFTLFFAGREFAPKAIIDGMNIEDYLQGHFVNACKHLAQRIREAGDLENDVVIGWESMNEPNRGLIGWVDLSVVPKEQKLQKGTSPTAWQAILTGSGRACEIDTWDFGGMGPYRSGSALVDPQGVTAWLPADYDHSHYGFKRDPDWKLGECLWAQHGVWDPSSDTLLRKDYFAKNPATGETVDYEYFTNHFFMRHYRRYRDAIRGVFPETIMFCQPPVLEIPPTIKNTEDDDPNMVFTPHFYDGVTLMTKKWNRLWNVDVFGVLRGKYLTPAFAIKIGETAIRNCFRDQLAAIMKEGLDNMGPRPCLFSEIGIPYDMDDKYAYRTGDYSSQILAMDANHFALEASHAQGFTLWTYVATNNHRWGDQWNGEDLSIYSADDAPLPSPSPASSSSAADPASPAYSRSQSSETQRVSPANLRESLSAEQPMSTTTSTPTKPGHRAAQAYIRPTPIATHGRVVSYGFDLRACTFRLALDAPSPTSEALPTEIFLPAFHFPRGGDNGNNATTVEVSGGKWSIDDVNVGMGEGAEESATVQRLRWWHAEGEQEIVVRGLVRKVGEVVAGTGEEEGYLEQCQQTGKNCIVM
ncbi:glycoside hydrolase family 5 protein [Aplosporella prunicola CBS 121167]|uniref:Glycoside hydrolase family 5 protein n=1 Tax=Aplosporella prunicola CBS 121167 TaxID=1176127 RepID=A0A6A6BR40_9PEZI|nr:glycoside hydrolase family 5 protein [Aplosporella prunicola CBS 121167]KAF2145704.1 glycoside hydrolase family 5 protein [Aplosporella prunicola CBS 121167]